MSTNEATIGIAELAEEIDRRPATIREWERTGVLPQKLRAVRNSRDRRMWTTQQVEGIKQWMVRTKRYPGRGLKGYDPTPAEVAEQVRKMRKAA